MPKNRTIVQYAVTPQSASTKNKFIQLALPKKSELKDILQQAKDNQEARIKWMSEKNKLNRLSSVTNARVHTEYITPTVKPHVIQHNQDVYKSFESYRSTSIEGSMKSLKNRNKESIIEANYYDTAGNKTKLI